ncbi:uncharacterized protein EV420DRAFT_1566466 [Desarmillaria tabescens]|uniref:F-box domain-containing protein n=1 Tax=Armillaria tabescens TaxID=1929756 RepID=A0AA39JWB5_ARMTA|nr:uncharacterized protein EV420DRAFT_1566466 [Desarmillaria tabescens]KAK0448976.1 hypothetical protein EV420DRAFT_1566466 [Desarmillaria tabescens]
MESPSSQVVKALTILSRDAESGPLSYGKTLGNNGSLSQKDISGLRKNTSSLNDDLAVLDWLSSVVPRRREEIRASIIFQTALLTHLPPTSPEEHYFFHCQPYNDTLLSSLPVEILTAIFQFAVDGSEYDDLDVKHSSNWVISHVCRVWRSVAVSTPNLWTSVSIEDDLLIDDPFTDDKAMHLKEYLSRSNQKPLRITLSSSYDIQKHLEILSPHFTRCTNLDLTITDETLDLLFAISSGFSSLRRLTVVVEGRYVFNDIQPGLSPSLSGLPFISSFGKAPCLRDVLLQGVGISYLELPLTKLESFTGDIYRYSEYKLLFSSAPQLITATLNVLCAAATFIILPEPLIHVKLHTLSLYTDIECLRGLRLPSLEVFRIQQIYSGGHHCYIAELIRESGCPLRSLYLEVPALPWSELQPIIEECSSTLTSLSIRVNNSSASQVHDALAFNGASYLAPCLKELCIRDDDYSLNKGFEASFHKITFFSMVFWRWYSKRVTQLKSLTMCAPYSPRPDEALRKLQELEEDSLNVEFHGYAWTKMI